MSVVPVGGLNSSSDGIEQFAETALNSPSARRSAPSPAEQTQRQSSGLGRHFVPVTHVGLLGLGGTFTAWTLKSPFFRSLVDTDVWIGSKTKKQQHGTLGMDSSAIQTRKWKIKLLENSLSVLQYSHSFSIPTNLGSSLTLPSVVCWFVWNQEPEMKKINKATMW